MAAPVPGTYKHPNLLGETAQKIEFPLQPALDGYSVGNDITMPPEMHRPFTALTLDEGMRVEVEQILSLVLTYIEDPNSWHTRALPARVVQSLQVEWEALTTHFNMLDHTPEGVKPRLVQIEVEKHARRLKHYQQGLDMRGEFFKTQKGMAEFQIKLESIRQNSKGTANVIIANALAEAHAYWQEHERRYGRVYGGIDDRIDEEIRTWCILGLDEKGIHKIRSEISDSVGGHPRSPNFNMGVVPRGFFTFLAFAHQYETEAYRRGDASTQRTLQGGGDAMRGVLDVPLYQDNPKAPQNMQVEKIDFFRRIWMGGHYAELQYNDWGEPNVAGIREPEIKVVSFPEDDWVKISASWCLDNCTRFDHTGRLSDEHQRLLDDLEAQARAFGGLNTEHPDPFLWKIHGQRIRNLGMNQTLKGADFALVEYPGDVDEEHRPFKWDAEFAIHCAMRLGLSEEEADAITTLLNAIESVYEISPSAISDTDATRISGHLDTLARAGIDEEWGGPDCSGLGGTFPSKPFFFGSIPAMMSLMKSRQHAKYEQWGYKNMDYDRTAMALRHLWHALKNGFPKHTLANSVYTPHHYRVKDDEVNQMNAMFTMLDHVKYPIFWTRLARNVQRPGEGTGRFTLFVKGMFPAGLFPDETPVALRSLLGDEPSGLETLEKGFKVLRPDEAGGQVAPDAEAGDFLGRYLNDGRGTVDKKRNFLAGLMDLAALYQGHDSSDFRSGQIPKLTDELIEALENTDAPVGRRTGALSGEILRHTQLRLTVTGKFFKGTLPTALEELRPADPKNPATFLGGDPPPTEHARAGLEDTIFAHAGLTKNLTVLEGGDPDAEHVTAELQPQYIGNAGQVLGGAFQLVTHDPGEPEKIAIKDRRFMIARFDALKHCNLRPLERLCGFLMLTARFHRDTLKAWIRIGAPIPMNFAIINPFFRVYTDAFMLCEGGEALGYFGYNFQDTVFQHDGGYKQWLLNYTMWAGAFVKDPTKLYWKPDAKHAGYISGNARKVFREPRQYDAAGDRAFDYSSRPDTWVVDLPISCDRTRMLSESKTIHLFGKPDQHYYDFRYIDKPSALRMNKPSFPSWFFYNMLFNFGKINDRQRYNGESFARMRANRFHPGACRMRAVQVYHKESNTWVMGYKGSSWLDRLGHPPILPTLNGKLTYGERRPFESD